MDKVEAQRQSQIELVPSLSRSYLAPPLVANPRLGSGTVNTTDKRVVKKWFDSSRNVDLSGQNPKLPTERHKTANEYKISNLPPPLGADNVAAQPTYYPNGAFVPLHLRTSPQAPPLTEDSKTEDFVAYARYYGISLDGIIVSPSTGMQSGAGQNAADSPSKRNSEDSEMCRPSIGNHTWIQPNEHSVSLIRPPRPNSRASLDAPFKSQELLSKDNVIARDLTEQSDLGGGFAQEKTSKPSKMSGWDNEAARAVNYEATHTGRHHHANLTAPKLETKFEAGNPDLKYTDHSTTSATATKTDTYHRHGNQIFDRQIRDINENLTASKAGDNSSQHLRYPTQLRPIQSATNMLTMSGNATPSASGKSQKGAQLSTLRKQSMGDVESASKKDTNSKLEGFPSGYSKYQGGQVEDTQLMYSSSKPLINMTTYGEQTAGQRPLVVQDLTLANVEQLSNKDSNIPDTHSLIATGKSPSVAASSGSWDNSVEEIGRPMAYYNDDSSMLPYREDDRDSRSGACVSDFVREWAQSLKSPGSVDLTNKHYCDGTGAVERLQIIGPLQYGETYPILDGDLDRSRAFQSAEIEMAKQMRYNIRRKRSRELAIKEQTDPALVENVFEDTPSRFTPKMPIYLRPVELMDMEGISLIYNHYIVNSIIPEDDLEVNTEDMKALYDTTVHDQLPFVVAIKGSMPRQQRPKKGETVLGFSFAEYHDIGLKGSSGRSRYTLRAHLYVDPRYVRKCIGRCLLHRLLRSVAHNHSETEGYDFMNHREDPLYWMPVLGGTAVQAHQVMIQRPIEVKNDPDHAWLEHWLRTEFFFHEAAILRSAGRSKDQNGNRWVDVVYFQATAAFRSTFR